MNSQPQGIFEQYNVLYENLKNGLNALEEESKEYIEWYISTELDEKIDYDEFTNEVYIQALNAINKVDELRAEMRSNYPAENTAHLMLSSFDELKEITADIQELLQLIKNAKNPPLPVINE